MSKDSVLDWDTTASNNQDIGGIQILDGSPVANFSQAFRELMSQVKEGVDYRVVYATKTSNYTAVANDNNAVHRYTSTATVSLTAAATLGANWHYTVVTADATVTIDPDSTETVDGASTLIVGPFSSVTIYCDGSNFFSDRTAMRRSFASPGYVMLGNRLVLQFGTFAGASDEVVSFPLTFSAVLTVYAQPFAQISATEMVSTSIAYITTTGMTVYPRLATNGGAVARAGAGGYWFALGWI